MSTLVGVDNFYGEALREQEAGEPVTHSSAPSDDQSRLPGAPLRHADPFVFLCGESVANHELH